jgi:hypothetical protein
MKALVFFGYGSAHFSSTKSYVEFLAGYLTIVLIAVIILLLWIKKKANKK